MDNESVMQESTRRRPVKKPKFEDTHSRETVWIRNDLKEKLNEWSEEGGRGEKTRVINEALEDYIKKNM